MIDIKETNNNSQRESAQRRFPVTKLTENVTHLTVRGAFPTKAPPTKAFDHRRIATGKIATTFFSHQRQKRRRKSDAVIKAFRIIKRG